MKNHVYIRLRRAKEEISTQLHFAKYRQARDVEYKKMLESVLSHCNIKSFPQKYKDELSAIFDFCYQREISNKFVWPILWRGRLFSKWDTMPDECKKELMATPESGLGMRTYPVHSHHFTEGMDEI